MGRKIPTCFCWSYLEANNISLLINWLDPDGKYIVVAPDWLSHLLSDLPSTLMLFIRFLYRSYTGRKKKYNFNIKFRSGVSKYAWFGLEAFVMGFLLQSASDKNINIKDKWIKLLSLCY